MRHIKQKHETGCGVACIAMLTEVPYDNVVRWLWPNAKPSKKSYRLRWGGIRMALEMGGLRYDKMIRPKTFTDLDKLSIVGIAPAPKMKHFHFVLWNPKTKRIFDPAMSKSMKVADFEREWPMLKIRAAIPIKTK